MNDNMIVCKIKNYLYKKNKYALLSLICGNKYDKIYAKFRGIKKAFLLMEPEYGNLGDQAIAYASELFISEKFPEYKLIPVSEKNTCLHINSIQKVCSKEDLIFLQGGGNMGSLYPYIERMRRFCIKKFKGQRVISLPTSIYYRDDKKGRMEFKKGLKVYNRHKNLYLMARDKESYDFMKNKYPVAKSFLVPDIVYYLTGKLNIAEERGNDVIVCLRNEIESTIGEHKRSNIISYLNDNIDNNVLVFDTVVGRNIPLEMRKYELNTLLKCFARARCVLTDRMHGMIFSYITNTPCVVLTSLGGKISGSYEWISDVDYIKLIKISDEKFIAEIISNMEKTNSKQDTDLLLKKFDNIRPYIT